MIREVAKRLPFARNAAGVARRAYRRLTSPRPVILVYHRVAEERFDPWNLAVSPANFADQMQSIRRSRTVLTLPEFARRHGDRTIPANAVAITFDDGYACNATTAAPLLRKLKIAATIFLPAKLMQSGRVFWWDELQRIVMDHSRTTIQLDRETVLLGERQERDRIWPAHPEQRTQRQSAFYRIWSRLQPLPEEALQDLMTELRAQAAHSAPAESHRLMTQEEARSIRSPEIQFGSHAMTHASLPHLSRREKAREIGESVAACESVTGERPQTFAYPFGEFDLECEKLVEEFGFLCACTTQRRSVVGTDRLFALPRVQVGNWNAAQLSSALRML